MTTTSYNELKRNGHPVSQTTDKHNRMVMIGDTVKVIVSFPLTRLADSNLRKSHKHSGVVKEIWFMQSRNEEGHVFDNHYFSLELDNGKIVHGILDYFVSLQSYG